MICRDRICRDGAHLLLAMACVACVLSGCSAPEPRVGELTESARDEIDIAGTERPKSASTDLSRPSEASTSSTSDDASAATLTDAPTPREAVVRDETPDRAGGRDTIVEPPETSAPPVDWNLARFDPIGASDAALERALFAEVERLCTNGQSHEAFAVCSEAIAETPARGELYWLRAVSALSAFGQIEGPIASLRGESPTGGAPLEVLLFVLADYQRALPALPRRPAPWSGLYHPMAQQQLLGALERVWSHGLLALVRLQALESGEVAVYEELQLPRPSLIDFALKAQLAALRGNGVGAKAVLESDLHAFVAPDAWTLWRPRLTALASICERLGTATREAAQRALKDWEDATRAAIPELRATLLVLPAATVRRVVAQREGSEEARLVAVPDAAGVLDRLPAASPDTSMDGVALRSELFKVARRLRDFRADVLRAVQSGTDDVLLANLLVAPSDPGLPGGLRFEEGGRLRVAFESVGNVRGASESESDTAPGVSLSCGLGFRLYWP